MADYYTQYSAEIDELTDAEIEWLEARLKDIEDARANDDGLGEDDHDLGQMELLDRTLWFGGDESGDPESAARFVRGFLKRFRPNDSFSMEYSFTCGRPRLDGFGGGAIFVAAEKAALSRSVHSTSRRRHLTRLRPHRRAVTDSPCP